MDDADLVRGPPADGQRPPQLSARADAELAEDSNASSPIPLNVSSAVRSRFRRRRGGVRAPLAVAQLGPRERDAKSADNASPDVLR
jgi:hypothetical protein